MRYLIPRRKGATISHLWNDPRTDTYCNMLQTGGMNPDRWRLSNSAPGMRLCKMCRQAAESGTTDLRRKV